MSVNGTKDKKISELLGASRASQIGALVRNLREGYGNFDNGIAHITRIFQNEPSEGDRAAGVNELPEAFTLDPENPESWAAIGVPGGIEELRRQHGQAARARASQPVPGV